MVLALEHRLQAERSTCPAEQRELDRVADIYTVLATLDLPMATFRKAACRRGAVRCDTPAGAIPGSLKSEGREPKTSETNAAS